MKTLKILSLIAFLILSVSACKTSTGGGGDGGCSDDSDCADYCDFTGTWRAGAAGSTTNGGFCPDGTCYCCYALFGKDPTTGVETDGRCLGCDEVGTNCDADMNVSCFTEEDVCLFYY